MYKKMIFPIVIAFLLSGCIYSIGKNQTCNLITGNCYYRGGSSQYLEIHRQKFDNTETVGNYSHSANDTGEFTINLNMGKLREECQAGKKTSCVIYDSALKHKW